MSMTNADLVLLNFVLCGGGLLVLGYAALIGWLYDDEHRHNQVPLVQSAFIGLGIGLVSWLVAWLLT
jgi:hypothetical protein